MNQVDQANNGFVEDNLLRGVILVKAGSFGLVELGFAKSSVR